MEDLKRKVAEFRDKRDWRKFHSPKDLSAAISIEASELQEHFLWKDKDEIESYIGKGVNMEKIKEEAADIQIFLLSFSDILDFDLGKAVLDKMEKNDAKYPVEKSKGSNKKYSEL